MIHSTYEPDSWEHIQASKVVFGSFGVTGNCIAGEVTNIDYILTDDIFIRSIELIAVNALFGDKITMKIIDIDGITGAPPGTILATIVSNYNVSIDQNKFLTYTSVIPKKALASMMIRVCYTSVSLLTPVNIAINYIVLKPIV